MQNHIIEQSRLLNKNGNLIQKGYATDLILDYKRNYIKLPSFMIKEWDYYAVLNDDFGIALTIADNGYLGLLSITVFDFTIPKECTKSIMVPFSLGRFNMPNTSKEGNIHVSEKGMSISFKRERGKRTLIFKDDDFHEGKSLEGKIFLEVNEEHDSLVIATPFHKKGRFYYNQKTNCQKATGGFKFGDNHFDFSKQDSFAVLDWGRGVWTYKNTWYWGSASGLVDGELFGFNIGYGFGDTSMASENMLFYNGKANKLNEIVFHIPDDDYLKPWKITSSDERFEMIFEPVIDRNARTKVLFLESDQHQVFGYFSGNAVLDDGEIIKLERFFGFAEKVTNAW